MFKIRTGLQLQELNAEIVPGVGRIYTTPSGERYPSVTTVIGARSKDKFSEWRKRVGEEEANRISREALARGSFIHDMMEKYILTGEMPFDGIMPLQKKNLLDLKKIIDANLEYVYAVECPLFSDNMRMAGRADLIGSWQGVTSIIDFKTSTKPKKREWIEDYFLQETAYSMMFQERTSLKANQIVTIICNDISYPQVFVERPNKWLNPLADAIQSYRAMTSTN